VPGQLAGQEHTDAGRAQAGQHDQPGPQRCPRRRTPGVTGRGVTRAVQRDREDEVFKDGGRPIAGRAECEGLAERQQGTALRWGQPQRRGGGTQRPPVSDRGIVRGRCRGQREHAQRRGQ
jgi:hypothetical protein